MIELVVDNFAGGGGASQGIEAAIGKPIDVAINHDLDAIVMHEANHPRTKHYHENIWQVDPRAVTQGRPISLAWFSPDCTHFSKAKGGKPVSKKIRALANIVPRWAEETDLRLFILENVEEFAEWGPLLKDGRPCPARKGFLFRRWWRRLERLGYRMEMRELLACDYGASTWRRRLFIIGRRDGLPIVWPARMFGPNLMPYHTAAEHLDFTRPVPSIFLTTEQAKAWAKYYGVRPPRRPLAEATMRRIGRGVWRYVLNNPQPFVIPLTHQGADRAYPVSGQLPTITAAHRGEFALCAPTLVQTGYGERKGQEPRCLDIQGPLGTIVSGGKHALVAAFLARHYGGHENDGAPLDTTLPTVTTKDHHSLITAHIQRDFGQSVGHPADVPLGSITADGGGKAALVSSHIIKLKGTCRDGHRSDEPLHVIQAGGLHYGEVRAFLQKYNGTPQDPRLEEPLHSVTTKARFGLVTVYGEDWVIADIGMRMLTPRELFDCQGFPHDYIIDPYVTKTVRGREVSKRLTATAQIRMCGNSVSPPVAEALVKANYVDLKKEIAA